MSDVVGEVEKVFDDSLQRQLLQRHPHTTAAEKAAVKVDMEEVEEPAGN